MRLQDLLSSGLPGSKPEPKSLRRLFLDVSIVTASFPKPAWRLYVRSVTDIADIGATWEMELGATLGRWRDRILDYPPIFDFIRELLDPSRNNIHQIQRDLKFDETRILDIGCGTGRLLVLARDTSVSWVGIDVNRSFVSSLNSILPENASLALMSADAMGFRDMSFDVAIMLDLTHHLSDRQVVTTLQHAKRLAHKRILVVDPIYVAGNPFRKLLCKMDRGSHIRTASELTELVGSAGSIVEQPSIFKSGLHMKCRVSIRFKP